MRKSSRELVQKSNTVAIEKRLGLIRGCDNQLKGETEGDGDQDKTNKGPVVGKMQKHRCESRGNFASPRK